MLNGAIELRHAPWIGWIHDLSAKDPYYILPIGMAIMMYLMTKMTPQTTTDPAQQKMMALMPLMMGFFFFNLSSGLNLYMFTSNLVGIGAAVLSESNRAASLRSESSKRKQSMPEERTAGRKRPYHERSRAGEARLDRERAISELKRFLDLAMREMGLAISSTKFPLRPRWMAPRTTRMCWSPFREPTRIFCWSTTRTYCLRSSMSGIAGCASIRGCTIACDSIAAIIARSAWKN